MRRSLYSSRLMNDTKWREVLLIVAQLRIQFELAFIGEEKFRTGMIFPAERLGPHVIADPGLTGGWAVTLLGDLCTSRSPLD